MNMQDIHLQIGEGGVDSRLRPHHPHNGHSDLHGLKCPRCESVNTKFCYYNNYNLLQPRYFCKGCRRYWTKGGVLRNVPVGGGCRKAKRSKTKSSQSAEHDDEMAVQLPRKRKSRSNSSSDSSSLTATTPDAIAFTTTATKSMSVLNPNSGFNDELFDCGIFSDIGNFSSLMASSGHQSLFGFNSVLDPHNHSHQQLKFEADMNLQHGVNLQLEIPTTECRFPDQNVVEVDVRPPLRPSTNCIFGPLDWQTNADQGLSDLDQAYWPSQTNQWTDVDQPSSLYLP